MHTLLDWSYSVTKTKSKAVNRPVERKNKILSVTLGDCDVDTFSAGGPGGQHQNTSNTGVRIRHRDSGATGEARDNRSQLQNKKAAFVRMTEHPKFKVWLNRQIYQAGETPEQRVEKDMRRSNLKIEAFQDDVWHVVY
jgi:protein subunit release factor B